MPYRPLYHILLSCPQSLVIISIDIDTIAAKIMKVHVVGTAAWLNDLLQLGLEIRHVVVGSDIALDQELGLRQAVHNCRWQGPTVCIDKDYDCACFCPLGIPGVAYDVLLRQVPHDVQWLVTVRLSYLVHVDNQCCRKESKAEVSKNAKVRNYAGRALHACASPFPWVNECQVVTLGRLAGEALVSADFIKTIVVNVDTVFSGKEIKRGNFFKVTAFFLSSAEAAEGKIQFTPSAVQSSKSEFF